MRHAQGQTFEPAAIAAQALKKIEEAYNIEYTYESNRIEGNTLTLQETELVVNEGVTIAGKSMREHLEAINHAEALDYIRDFAKSDIEISVMTIKEIHALVLHGINRENAGRYRTVPVRISGSTHTPPQPYLLDKQMEDFMLRFGEMEAQGEHPVLIAAYLHEVLVRIRPFIDGNGRTSRLLMNLYLLRHGYTIVNFKGWTFGSRGGHCEPQPFRTAPTISAFPFRPTDTRLEDVALSAAMNNGRVSIVSTHNEEVAVCIYNLDGRVLWQGVVAPGCAADTGLQDGGIYLIRMEQKKGLVKTQKLIVR